MIFIKGDIILGQGFGKDKLKAFHPIVYIEGDTSTDFTGLMLTTSPNKKWANNFPLKNEHFLTTDDTGKVFEIGFKNSHCVHMLLNKRSEWAPFEKKGQLSREGISFIERNLIDSSPIYWDEYIADISKK